MFHLLIAGLLLNTAYSGELKLNPDDYTLFPEESDVINEEIPLVYNLEDTITETVIFEDEPLVLKPEEENK